jgi:serine/threonine protein kinase
LASHIKTKQEFVVKKVVRRFLHPSDVASLNDEMSVLQALRDCKHVVRLQEVFESPDSTCLVLEHFKGKALIDCLVQQTKYTEFSAKELIRNLLLGVAHCHKNRIANRNLKLENLLLVSLGVSIWSRIWLFFYLQLMHPLFSASWK